MRWLLVVVVMVGSTSLWAADGDLPGSGTEGDPYLIEDLADFDEFADSVNAPTYWASGVYTKLACDPNLADRTYTTAVIAPDTPNTDWEFNGTPFEGIFDGDDHVIGNLTIDTAGASNHYLGLFGKITYASVSNLGMENINITGGDNSWGLGGLCGWNEGMVLKCHATGSVSGNSWVGGLCGLNHEGTLRNCWVAVSVTGEGRGYPLGGLSGGNLDGTISYCYATGSVSGDDSESLGGLCGENTGSISYCYATGSVTSGDYTDYLGGLCGMNDGGALLNCYATGAVRGGYRSDSLGGLCGEIWDGAASNCYATGSVTAGMDSTRLGGLSGGNLGGTISNSWAMGAVAGGENSYDLGGLIGLNWEGLITNCFWDIETGGVDNGFGTPLPTAQMQTMSTFVDNDWDFTNESTNGTADIWRLCVDGTDYPRLAWEFGSDYSCPDGVSIEDLLYLSNRWLESGLNPYTSADRTGDGKVTIQEYALLARQWTRQ